MVPRAFIGILLAAALLLAGCLGADSSLGDPLEEAGTGEGPSVDEANDPSDEDNRTEDAHGASTDASTPPGEGPRASLHLDQRHLYAVPDDTLILEGTLEIHEQATGTLALNVETPKGWNATTNPGSVTMSEATTVPIQATVIVPSDAEAGDKESLALSLETADEGTLAQTTAAVTVTEAYELTNFKVWDTADLDILIIPPVHGPMANTEEGPLPYGADGAGPAGAYLDATLHVLHDWAYAIDRVVENETQIAWVDQVDWDIKVVAEDEVTIEDVQEAEIVKVYTETTYPIGGAAWNGGAVDCLAYTTMWSTYGSMTYEDMYMLAGHELLHCFGMSHPEEHEPQHDIMSYEPMPLTDLRCPSNLNVWAMAAAFAGVTDGDTGPGSGDTIRLPQPTYEQHCDPDADPR